MNERTSGRLGILEGAAIVLTVAVACLAIVRAEPGLRGCAAAVAPVVREAGAAAKPTPEADAADMLLHD
jgi:hypothetical protein